jgi:PAS domain S-box-containing protein
VKEVSLRDLLKYLGPVVALFVILLGYLFYRRQVERNLAHAAVAQSRNLLLAIIDTAPVRVYWKDKNLRYLGCNAAFAKDAGMDHPKDVIGKDDFQMGWAAQAEQMHRDDMAIMESGFARLFYDEPQMTPAGTTRWLRMSKVLLVDKNKEVIGLLGVYEDTTQQKEMEQALLVSNNLMRNILDNIPVGLSAFDKDLKLIAHNRLFQETLDFPDALVCEAGTSFEKIIRFNAERGEYGAGDPDQLVRTVIERARRPQLHQFERVRPNGVTLEVRGAPMPGGGFVTTYADISERKRVEGVERRLTAQLRLDEERAHDFSLSASDWFWETDAEHRFCFFSSSFEQIYGLSTDLWIGKSRREILAMDRFNPMETVKAHLAQLDERQPFKNFEYQVRRTDGIVIWVSVSGLPHFDVNGDFAGYRGTGTLISERKAIEESLRQAVQQAQAATLTKSRFLTTMSHEIRTPMNGILGMAQLLLMPDLTESQRRSYARTILSSGQALLTLLNDILDLSKIEAGKLQLDSTVFEPNALLRETWTLFSGVVQAKGLQMAFEWQGADDQRYVADSNRLRQMLSNLVGNAIKFTSEGRVRMEGREIERAGDSAILEFSVSDTGIGIPAEKIDLLFKPFSQTDSSMTRQFGGTGLGLSIVLNLAKAMGGEVGVESVAGEGSRFWFRLRAKPVSVGDESRRIERPQQDTGTSVVPLTPLARPDVRVLVVEDNPVNCKVIELFLRKLGVSATLLTDGQQALDAITQGDRYDLVLMDLHMPVMDGYAATERIRQWESDLQRPRLPILALTADAFEEDRLHCLAAGMDDVLTKPINLDVLKSSLTRWLPTAAGGVLPGKIASTPAVRKVDRALFLAQIEELRPLLERNMFDSIVRFEELQTLVSGTDIAAEVNEIAALLAQLSFDAALARLSLLAQSQSGNRGA